MQPKVNILFIEDERNILAFVTKLLYGHNYKVTTAATGTEGLQLINSLCPDLILLDLGLPDMDGQTDFKYCFNPSKIKAFRRVNCNGDNTGTNTTY